MQRAYDVVVVGAGPAGSVAARKFAESGLKVLMIEKRQEIGAPVRCAEAVGADITRPYITIEQRWVDAYITSYAVYNMIGDYVRVPPTEPTLVVDRKVFDRELAHLAVRAGAEVQVKTQATGLIIEHHQVVGVRLSSLGKEGVVHARLVIAADGTESQVARWAGLKTVPSMADFYVGFQYLLGNLRGRIDPTVCEYHLGQTISPGGYAWVFPKGDDIANVGLAISADRAKIPAQTYLDRFVEHHFPGSSVLAAVAGGIPVTGALNRMVADGLMVVGDAAHQADPLTGGGINLGMIGGDLAAQVGIKALARGDVSTKVLHEYETLWNRRFAAQHTALHRIRKALIGMDDERLINLIQTGSTLPLQTMGLSQIMFALFKSDPRLLAEAPTLVATGLILK